MEKQIKRITQMEQALDRAQTAVDALEQALESYRSARTALKALEAYLNSAERRQDVADDENGLLPDGLRRGVLSEDAIWNLLEQNDALIRSLKDVCADQG